jgi:hypothetical protein
MIRRSFWLATGAVLGITGDRRVTRTARALLPHGDLLGQLQRRAGPAAAGRRPSRAGTETIAFVRDVRAGMADYLDRHRET